MEQTDSKQYRDRQTDNWLQEAFYLKLHLELTLLAAQYKLPWEACEDIASESLSALWLDYRQTGWTFPIKSYLIERMKLLVRQQTELTFNQTATEGQYLTNQMMTVEDNTSTREVLAGLPAYLFLLETDEQFLLKEILFNGKNIGEAGKELNYSPAKTRKLFKHVVFKLQKHLGLWKKVRK